MLNIKSKAQIEKRLQLSSSYSVKNNLSKDVKESFRRSANKTTLLKSTANLERKMSPPSSTAIDVVTEA